MKPNHYIKRVEESPEFKKFKSENPKSKLCAGFFILDFEAGKDIHQIDYLLPNKKVATFILDEGVKMKISEQALKKGLPELEKNAETDLEMLKGIVEDEMKNRTVTDNIKKIIAVLHVLDGKKIWNLQCILDGLGLLNVHVDDSDQSILKFEKHSLMDMIRMMPSGSLSEKQLGKKGTKLSKADLAKLTEQIEKALKSAREKAKSGGKLDSSNSDKENVKKNKEKPVLEERKKTEKKNNPKN